MEQTGVGGGHQAKRSRNRNGRGIRLRDSGKPFCKGEAVLLPGCLEVGAYDPLPYQPF